jgi:hypothetical protein
MDKSISNSRKLSCVDNPMSRPRKRSPRVARDVAWQDRASAALKLGGAVSIKYFCPSSADSFSHHRSVSSDPDVPFWVLSVDFCDSSAIYGNFFCNGASPVDRSQRNRGAYLVALRELGMSSGRYIPSRSRARRALKIGKNHSCLQRSTPSKHGMTERSLCSLPKIAQCRRLGRLYDVISWPDYGPNSSISQVLCLIDVCLSIHVFSNDRNTRDSTSRHIFVARWNKSGMVVAERKRSRFT